MDTGMGVSSPWVLEALPALPPYQVLEVYPNDKGLRKDSPSMTLI